MYGAILGDIISLYHKREESGIYYLVKPKVKFTDHTVTLVALADALTSTDSADMNQLEEKIRQSLIRWGKEYWNPNYSEHFKKWLANPEPIEDYDNGAAVRATIIPYLYTDRDLIEKVTELSTLITHCDSDKFIDSRFVCIIVVLNCPQSGEC